MNGLDELEGCRNLLRNTNTDVHGMSSMTCESLLAIYRAFKRSDYDITPDYWTKEEINLALSGKGKGATSER